MLFVVVALGQEPKLVPAVVEPLACGGGQGLAGKFWIHEQIWMPREADLHDPAAILRDYDQLHPAIGDPLRMPALVIDRFDAALGGDIWIHVSDNLSMSYARAQPADHENRGHVSHLMCGRRGVIHWDRRPQEAESALKHLLADFSEKQ